MTASRGACLGPPCLSCQSSAAKVRADCRAGSAPGDPPRESADAEAPGAGSSRRRPGAVLSARSSLAKPLQQAAMRWCDGGVSACARLPRGCAEESNGSACALPSQNAIRSAHDVLTALRQVQGCVALLVPFGICITEEHKS